MNKNTFETIWEDEILPYLKELKEERKLVQQQVVWVLPAIFSLALILAPFSAGFRDFWWVSVIGIVATVALFSKLHTVFAAHFSSKSFKEMIFDALSSLTDFDWKIHFPDKLTEAERKEYRRKVLFTDAADFDSLDKDDPLNVGRWVEGVWIFKESGLYTNYSISGCENKLTASWNNSRVEAYQTTVDRPATKAVWSRDIMFRGFIIKVQIDKQFRGETYVQTETDSDERWFNFSSDPDVKETELEWIDFEKFLMVRSSDPAEAREIFTPDFMVVIYDWWENHGKPLRIAFKNDAVYIAYPTDVSLEPSIFGSLKAEKKVALDTLEFQLFVEEVVKTVLGNQRLWLHESVSSQSSD